jgi:endonuclease III
MIHNPSSNRQLPITSDFSAADRIPLIIERLRQAHPDASCALHHQSALQLLVATILSAQCTDERVNQVTPLLFARYPTAAALAEADRAELEEIIRSTGFYRNKAASIQATARVLVDEYGGEVPAEMDKLLQLRGVARKTANVVLGVVYGIADGVVVDTHVKRLSHRLGLAEANTPEKIERELMELVPRDCWIEISHLLIFHGRRICDARKPDCANCPLNDLCPAAVVGS